jgi:hypothetical protein
VSSRSAHPGPSVPAGNDTAIGYGYRSLTRAGHSPSVFLASAQPVMPVLFTAVQYLLSDLHFTVAVVPPVAPTTAEAMAPGAFDATSPTRSAAALTSSQVQILVVRSGSYQAR